MHVNNLSEHNSVYTMLAHLPDKLTFKEKHPEKSEIYGFQLELQEIKNVSEILDDLESVWNLEDLCVWNSGWFVCR